MYTFSFTYSDGTTYSFKNVTRILISTASGTKEISGDDIAVSRLPLSNTYLYTPDGCISVSGNNLLVISVSKQDD